VKRFRAFCTFIRSFTLGGKEARAVRLMNVWGRSAHHSVIGARCAMGARGDRSADARDFPMEQRRR
jgi:hypothetical protein